MKQINRTSTFLLQILLLAIFLLLPQPLELEAQTRTLDITGQNLDELVKITELPLSIYYLQSAAISPNRQMLVFSTGTGTIIYDIASRQATTVADVNGNGGANAVAFSIDSAYIAVAARTEVKIISTSTRQVIQTLYGHSSTVNAVAFSPTGRTLASGGDDRSIRLWSTSSWSYTNTFERFDAFGIRSGFGEDEVHSLLFAPNGELLIAGTVYGRLDFWAVATGEVQSMVPEFQDRARAEQLALTPTGYLVALMNDHIISWNMQNQRVAANIRPSFFSSSAIAVSPDGRLLAAVGNSSFGVFDLLTGEEIITRSLSLNGSGYTNGILWPDNRSIIVIDSTGATIWGVRDNTVIPTTIPVNTSSNNTGSNLGSSSSSSTGLPFTLPETLPFNLSSLNLEEVENLPLIALALLLSLIVVLWLFKKILGAIFGVLRFIFGGGSKKTPEPVSPYKNLGSNLRYGESSRTTASKSQASTGYKAPTLAELEAQKKRAEEKRLAEEKAQAQAANTASHSLASSPQPDPKSIVPPPTGKFKSVPPDNPWFKT